MYCSSCGSAIPPNLTFCKICGAKLTVSRSDPLTKPTPLFPESLIAAMVATLVFGTGVIIGLMTVMKAVGFEIAIILGVSMLLFGLMFVIEAFLIFLILSAKRDAKKRERRSEQLTKEIEESQARLLSEPLQSVTEHTTRSFDPVYIDQKRQ